MAGWQKFNVTTLDLASGVHNLGSDALKVALTNVAPTFADDTISDIAQISAAGGYVPANVTVASSSQTGGTYSLMVNAFTWTASGGSFDPFRYLVLYNDTSASKSLIAWIDYGISYTLPSGQPFTHQAAELLNLA